LCLIEDANLVLADRLIYALDKLVETLPKEDKGRLSNWICGVCQQRDVSYIQAVEVAWLPRYFKLQRYFSFSNLAAVDLSSSLLLVAPYCKLLVN
jgi:hypothetical protein